MPLAWDLVFFLFLGAFRPTFMSCIFELFVSSNQGEVLLLLMSRHRADGQAHVSTA